MKIRGISDFVLLAISAAGVAGGLAARLFGLLGWAAAIWIAGSLPVLIALVVGIGRAMMRGEAGLDLIALLSTGGALALGEYATAAVIGLMLASGRCLEAFAEGRARREMSALLARAPHLAGDPVRALAVLVVAAPCPLILAVPVATVGGISRCTIRGIMVKGAGVLERLAEAKTLMFDKTGTLTGGQARWAAIETGARFGAAAEIDAIIAKTDRYRQR